MRATRARLIIELADGRAVYWEARDPQLAEYTTLPGHLNPWDSVDVSVFSDWLGDSRMRLAGEVALRIRGGHPWQIRIEQDSGEIPPALAGLALDWIKAMPVAVGPLRVLRPYLARIAGTRP